jgi:hypothetical protein
MAEKTKDQTLHDHNDAGVDRSGFLKCTALSAAVGMTVKWIYRGDIPRMVVSTDDAKAFEFKDDGLS